MGLKSLGISLVLIMVGSFAAIMFAIGFAQDNGATQSLGDDPFIDELSSNLSSNLGQYGSDAEDAVVSFSNSTPTVGSDSLQIESTANNWRSGLSSGARSLNNVLTYILNTVFGGSSSQNNFMLVFGVVSALIVILAILYAWAWIRGGIFD